MQKQGREEEENDDDDDEYVPGAVRRKIKRFKKLKQKKGPSLRPLRTWIVQKDHDGNPVAPCDITPSIRVECWGNKKQKVTLDRSLKMPVFRGLRMRVWRMQKLWLIKVERDGFKVWEEGQPEPEEAAAETLREAWKETGQTFSGSVACLSGLIPQQDQWTGWEVYHTLREMAAEQEEQWDRIDKPQQILPVCLQRVEQRLNGSIVIRFGCKAKILSLGTLDIIPLHGSAAFPIPCGFKLQRTLLNGEKWITETVPGPLPWKVYRKGGPIPTKGSASLRDAWNSSTYGSRHSGGTSFRLSGLVPQHRKPRNHVVQYLIERHLGSDHLPAWYVPPHWNIAGQGGRLHPFIQFLVE